MSQAIIDGPSRVPFADDGHDVPSRLQVGKGTARHALGVSRPEASPAIRLLATAFGAAWQQSEGGAGYGAEKAAVGVARHLGKAAAHRDLRPAAQLVASRGCRPATTLGMPRSARVPALVNALWLAYCRNRERPTHRGRLDGFHAASAFNLIVYLVLHWNQRVDRRGDLLQKSA